MLVVDFRMMPVVGLPDGSVVASLNVIRASAISGWKTAGVDDLSAFVARKSWLRMSIWLLIWASERFSVVFRCRTWTTTGISVQPVRSAAAPRLRMRDVRSSMALRASA